MLLFVKKHYADLMRAGAKTLEIRAGTRYRNVHVGCVISINGRDRYRVTARQDFDTIDQLIEATQHAFRRIGIATMIEYRSRLLECYPDGSGPFFVWRVTMI